MRRFCLSVILFLSIAFIVTAQSTISLDEAINKAGLDIFSKFEAGTRIAIVNITCESTDMSTYIIDKLTEKLVNETSLVIAERSTAAMDAVNKELYFQYSGDVSDETAVGMGKRWGAQAIINGRFQRIGKTYQLTIRSVDVETSTIKVQKSLLVSDSEIIADLMDTTYVPTVNTTNTTTSVNNSLKNTITKENTLSKQSATATTKMVSPSYIGSLIKKDLTKNSDFIQNSTKKYAYSQKRDLYDKYKKSSIGAFALNLISCCGIGSFVQGDVSGAFSIIGGELASVGLIYAGASIGSFPIMLTGVGCVIGFNLYSWIRPFSYAKGFNKKLAESLNLYDMITYVTPVFSTDVSIPQLALGAKIRL